MHHSARFPPAFCAFSSGGRREPEDEVTNHGSTAYYFKSGIYRCVYAFVRVGVYMSMHII